MLFSWAAHSLWHFEKREKYKQSRVTSSTEGKLCESGWIPKFPSAVAHSFAKLNRLTICYRYPNPISIILSFRHHLRLLSNSPGDSGHPQQTGHVRSPCNLWPRLKILWSHGFKMLWVLRETRIEPPTDSWFLRIPTMWGPLDSKVGL